MKLRTQPPPRDRQLFRSAATLADAFGLGATAREPFRFLAHVRLSPEPDEATELPMAAEPPSRP